MAKGKAVKAKEAKKDKPLTVCHLCRKETAEEQFCFGCKSYICENCDKTFCMGNHVPGDHLRVTYGEYHGDD